MSENSTLYQSKIYELKKASMFLREDGIIQVDTKEVDEYTIEDAKEALATISEIGSGKKFPILMIAAGYLNIDKETRMFLAKEEANRFTLADAYVINSLALKLIGNFYLKFDNPASPSKIFTKTEDAVVWLKTFI